MRIKPSLLPGMSKLPQAINTPPTKHLHSICTETGA